MLGRLYLVAGVAAVTVLAGWYMLHLRGDLAESELLVRQYHDREVKQRGVNRALQQQSDDMAAINGGLLVDLERLRQRVGRLSETARTACQGATGAELSGQDAGFLAGEAARADTLRAALVACYAYADALQQD